MNSYIHHNKIFITITYSCFYCRVTSWHHFWRLISKQAAVALTCQSGSHNQQTIPVLPTALQCHIFRLLCWVPRLWAPPSSPAGIPGMTTCLPSHRYRPKKCSHQASAPVRRHSFTTKTNKIWSMRWFDQRTCTGRKLSSVCQ